MTDKAVTERFGARTRRTAYASVAVAGHADGAIRAAYDDAADGALTTAAAFLHVGRWLVKLRVTGPPARRKEVLAGLGREPEARERGDESGSEGQHRGRVRRQQTKYPYDLPESTTN